MHFLKKFFDGGSRKISRRKFLRAAGLGAAGIGFSGAVAAKEGFRIFRSGSKNSGLTVENQTTKAGEFDSQSLTDDFIVADTADEIQPAIDELAEDMDENGAGGGVVQLKARKYYPETTIWVKGGVTLQGVKRSRSSLRPGSKYSYDGSTVISTRNMEEGSEAYTYEHDEERPHPHFPVIANFNAPPVEDGQIRERDPTEYEKKHWGNDIGIRNVVIDGREKQRWWDWDKHGGGSIYNTEEDATYFGVYDATLFERGENILTENIETIGFLGYGGFWRDCQNAVDRGGIYRGGATDYHGSAYWIDRQETSNTYTSGVWAFEAEGPMPTVKFSAHIDNYFPSAAWTTRNLVVGKDRVFIGNEQDYWDGNAPLTDPSRGDKIWLEMDQRSNSIDGYRIERKGRKKDCSGLVLADNNARYSNIEVVGCKTAFDAKNGNLELINITARDSELALLAGTHQPTINGFQIMDCDYGFEFSGRANLQGMWNGVNFVKGCRTAFKNNNNKPCILNHPNFGGVEEFGQNFDELKIKNPANYENIDDFPEEHKP